MNRSKADSTAFPRTRVSVDNRLSSYDSYSMLSLMPEIVKFVHHGAAMITPKVLKGVYKKLPFLKLKFAELDDPRYPHLPDQLEFLADVVEDFGEGFEEELPFTTLAAVTFALIYANRQLDLIPDTVPEFGHADDSAVVRAVLIQHEKPLAAYAARHKLKFDKALVEP